MTTRTAQQAFILCTSLHHCVQNIITELTHRLEGATTTLRYGKSAKCHYGFLVVEAAQGIPDTVVQWLQSEPYIKEYVICNVPGREEAIEDGITSIIQALSQVLQGHAKEAGSGPAPYQEYLQTAAETIKSALQRIGSAVMREEAAVSHVTKACNDMVRRPDNESQDEEDLYFQSLLWLDDACEGAIRELFQVATLWQHIGEDTLIYGGLSGTAIQYYCLQQRRRVTKLALAIMDRQLKTQREEGRLNNEAYGMTQAELQGAQGAEERSDA